MRRLSLRIRLFLLTVLYVGSISSSDFVDGVSIRDLSLGSTTIGTGSPLSLAGYGELPNQLVAGYRNKFSMKEMAVVSLAGVYHSSSLDHAVYVSSAGYDDYRQTLASLGCQKQLSDNLSLGVAVQSLSLSAITLESSLWQLYPRIGFEYKLTPSFILGLDIDNPVRLGSKDHERLGSHFATTFGTSYRQGELLLLAGQYRWEESLTDRFMFGVEFSLIPDLRLRAGFSTHPFSPSFGCGYSFRNWILDVASEYHRYLGNSLSVGLSYHFKK